MFPSRSNAASALTMMTRSSGCFSFVEQVSAAGCETFIVHARKAWLKGLSPKANRDIPPLNYPLVAKLKRERPDLTIILNGGLASVAASSAAVTDLADWTGRCLAGPPIKTPGTWQRPIPHSLKQARISMIHMLSSKRCCLTSKASLSKGERLHAIARHILGLFQGRPGARAYRRHISENSPREGAGTGSHP